MSNGNRIVPSTNESFVAVPVSAEAYKNNKEVMQQGYIELHNANEAGHRLWQEQQKILLEKFQRAAQEEEAKRRERIEAE
jgi:hypothetical protein